jgi:hypothetical protein
VVYEQLCDASVASLHGEIEGGCRIDIFAGVIERRKGDDRHRDSVALEKETGKVRVPSPAGDLETSNNMVLPRKAIRYRWSLRYYDPEFVNATSIRSKQDQGRVDVLS